MSLLLIRHADAGVRGTWRGDDRARPLSDRGRDQAARLPHLVADHPLDRVLTSPFARCVETVEPLAAARGLPVERHPDLAEATPRMLVRELLWSLDGSSAALCSHGDVIGDLIGELRMLGVTLPPNPRWEKASTWVIDVAGRAVTAATYLPPPA